MNPGLNLIKRHSRYRIWMQWKGREIYIGSTDTEKEARKMMENFVQTAKNFN